MRSSGVFSGSNCCCCCCCCCCDGGISNGSLLAPEGLYRDELPLLLLLPPLRMLEVGEKAVDGCGGGSSIFVSVLTENGDNSPNPGLSDPLLRL